MVLGDLDSYMLKKKEKKRKKLEKQLKQYTKTNSRWKKDLNI